MNLESGLGGDLQSGGMHDTKISNEVTTVSVDDNELTLPEFLIIRNDIVVGVALTDLVLRVVALEDNLKVSELISVNSCESKAEGGWLRGVGWEVCDGSTVEVNSLARLTIGKVPRAELTDCHAVEIWNIPYLIGLGELILRDVLILSSRGDSCTSTPASEVHLVTLKKRLAAISSEGFHVSFFDQSLNGLAMISKINGKIALKH